MYGDVLGYGSYSTVVLAEHRTTGVKYAVKIVSKVQLINEDKHRCAMRERDILRTLDHPNIIKLLSTFQTPDELHYVMEYAENGELLDHIKKRGRFDEAIARRVTAELVNALEHLRHHHVVHRDIKPENVMFDRDFHVKLVDFGTAIVSDEEPRPLAEEMRTPSREDATDDTLDAEASEDRRRRHSRSREAGKSFCGTAQYASPELLRSCTTTYSSDLWALGCVVFQLLTGRRPFQDPSDYLTFKRISERDVRYPPGFPPVARDLCDALLVLNPCDRLGVGPDGYPRLKAHPFFEGIDFSTISDEPPNLVWRTHPPPPPPWVPDHLVDRCSDCQAPFSLFLRKHHCRACGQIFCAECSRRTIEVPHVDPKRPLRVCQQCHDDIRRQGQAAQQAKMIADF